MRLNASSLLLSALVALSAIGCGPNEATVGTDQELLDLEAPLKTGEVRLKGKLSPLGNIVAEGSATYRQRDTQKRLQVRAEADVTVIVPGTSYNIIFDHAGARQVIGAAVAVSETEVENGVSTTQGEIEFDLSGTALTITPVAGDLFGVEGIVEGDVAAK